MFAFMNNEIEFFYIIISAIKN